MNKRPLLVLAALAAAAEPDLGRATLDQLKGKLLGQYADDPVGSTVSTVLLASFLFYRAERGKNPKVSSYYDALSYIATSLSVGYSDIFPKTETGKAIGAAIQTVGPAMSANLFESMRVPKDAPSPTASDEVVARLDRILAVLEAKQAAASST